MQRAKDKLADDRELLTIEKKALGDQTGVVKVNADTDQAHAVDLYAKKTDDFAARFRKQA